MVAFSQIQPFLILPLVYFTRGIDFSDGSSNLLILRSLFIAVHVALLGVLFFIRSRIGAVADSKMITVTPVKAPFSQETPEPRQITVEMYDSEQLHELVKGILMNLAILGFIHYKFSAAVPLVTQIFLGPVKVISHELFQSHILGKVIARPFEVPKGPFADMLENLTGGGGDASKKDKKEKKPEKAPSIDGGSKKKR